MSDTPMTKAEFNAFMERLADEIISRAKVMESNYITTGGTGDESAAYVLRGLGDAIKQACKEPE